MELINVLIKISLFPNINRKYYFRNYNYLGVLLFILILYKPTKKLNRRFFTTIGVMHFD
jgi:hypothetical protein